MVQGEQWGEERSVCVVQGAFVVRGSDNMRESDRGQRLRAAQRGIGRGGVPEVQGARAHGGMGDWHGG